MTYRKVDNLDIKVKETKLPMLGQVLREEFIMKINKFRLKFRKHFVPSDE